MPGRAVQRSRAKLAAGVGFGSPPRPWAVRIDLAVRSQWRRGLSPSARPPARTNPTVPFPHVSAPLRASPIPAPCPPCPNESLTYPHRTTRIHPSHCRVSRARWAPRCSRHGCACSKARDSLWQKPIATRHDAPSCPAWSSQAGSRVPQSAHAKAVACVVAWRNARRRTIDCRVRAEGPRHAELS